MTVAKHAIRYEKGSTHEGGKHAHPFGTKAALCDVPGVFGVGQTIQDAREDLRAKVAKKLRIALASVEFVEDPGSVFAEHAGRAR